jgi:hypothetical protein
LTVLISFPNFTEKMKILLRWTTIIPILAWILYFSGLIENSVLFQVLAGILLIFSVMFSVNHSEIIALRVGEPYERYGSNSRFKKQQTSNKPEPGTGFGPT